MKMNEPKQWCWAVSMQDGPRSWKVVNVAAKTSKGAWERAELIHNGVVTKVEKLHPIYY